MNPSLNSSYMPYVDQNETINEVSEMETMKTINLCFVFLLCALGFCGNISVFIVWYKHSDFRVWANSFHLSMAIIDFYVCVFVLPFEIAYLVLSKDNISKMTQLLRAVRTTAILALCINFSGIVGIAYSRYRQIKNPSNPISKRFYIISLTLIWLGGLLIIIVMIIKGYCVGASCQLTPPDERKHRIGYFIAFFFIASVVVTVGYLIATALLERRLRRLSPYTMDQNVFTVMVQEPTSVTESTANRSNLSSVDHQFRASVNRNARSYQNSAGMGIGDIIFESVTIQASRHQPRLRYLTQPVFRKIIVRDERNILIRMVLIFAILLVSLIALIIAIIVDSTIPKSAQLKTFLGYILFLNNCLSPYVYIWRQKEYRHTLKLFLHNTWQFCSCGFGQRVAPNPEPNYL